MDIFSQHLRERAAQLGISHAEAARRCGLEERRYSHYVTGRREPDLGTLVAIAQALGTTPNWLLGLDSTGASATKRSQLVDRMVGALAQMTAEELRIAVLQAEAVVRARQTDGNSPV